MYVCMYGMYVCMYVCMHVYMYAYVLISLHTHTHARTHAHTHTHSHADGTNFECGTIHSQEEVDGASVVVLQATFISPIAGTMYFK